MKSAYLVLMGVLAAMVSQSGSAQERRLEDPVVSPSEIRIEAYDGFSFNNGVTVHVGGLLVVDFNTQSYMGVCNQIVLDAQQYLQQASRNGRNVRVNRAILNEANRKIRDVYVRSNKESEVIPFLREVFGRALEEVQPTQTAERSARKAKRAPVVEDAREDEQESEESEERASSPVRNEEKKILQALVDTTGLFDHCAGQQSSHVALEFSSHEPEQAKLDRRASEIARDTMREIAPGQEYQIVAIYNEGVLGSGNHGRDEAGCVSLEKKLGAFFTGVSGVIVKAGYAEAHIVVMKKPVGTRSAYLVVGKAISKP